VASAALKTLSMYKGFVVFIGLQLLALLIVTNSQACFFRAVAKKANSTETIPAKRRQELCLTA